MVVRETIANELAAFGGKLDAELKRQRIALTEFQRQMIASLLEERGKGVLLEQWQSWANIRDDKLKLETALGLLADYLNGNGHPEKLSPLLDGVCEEYLQSHRTKDPRKLAHFLFSEKQLRGVEHSDYYNPMNSNLIYVLEKRRGIPISLACVYILVGHRLGLEIEGCNFPGHFLALVSSKRQKYIVDCYNGGYFISEKDFAHLAPPGSISMNDILRLECDAQTIVARFLRNLIKAYEHRQDPANVRLMTDLHSQIDPGGEEE